MLFSSRKFYMWGPRTHGPLTFGIVARSEKEARSRIDEYIKEKLRQPIYTGEPEKSGISVYDCEGWGADGYYLEVFGRGKVMTHPND